ncbi:MAG TPA: VWA domain-containing protein [Epulopiscium sp.]|nr:VWA domain-containing protein [Candidatus Epulonipiscium sp.]
MGKGKINILLVFFSLIGTVVGFLVGEWLLYKLGGNIPGPLLMGLYFGQLSFFIGIMCLIAEIISPIINGVNWKVEYRNNSWLHLVPATFVMLFVSGALFQFIYQLDYNGPKKPNDVMIVMDISGSMFQTDPNNDRLNAANDFIDHMKKNQRVGVIAFDDQSYVIQPMVYLKDDGVKAEVKEKIMGLAEPMGGTEIAGALNAAMQHIQETAEKGRKAMVILLSDGYSYVDLDGTLSPYKQEEIVIYTIGMADPSDASGEGIELLRQIANSAGGEFYNVEESIDVTNVMKEIYSKDNPRWLVGKRQGVAADSLLYKMLRILFLGGIGTLIGLSVGIIFDNRYLAKAYIVGGAFSGLISGMILEIFMNRFLAVFCLGTLFTVFSLFAKMKQKSYIPSNRSIGPM